jgi:hypothetical protein
LNKLNFGCGARYASGWTNIDFHGDGVHVTRVNLLAGFPFPDSTFDAVYSSHVLEHFTPEQGRFLIAEASRVLRPGGILRTVVPDLEASCHEYIRILAMSDSDPDKRWRYDWIKIELLDQLIRTRPGGAMGPYMQSVIQSGDHATIEYIESRTESHRSTPELPTDMKSRLARMTWGKVTTKLTYLYLQLVQRIIPGKLRPMVWNATTIGEKHRWMYDRYDLTQLMQTAGSETFASSHSTSLAFQISPPICSTRTLTEAHIKMFRSTVRLQRCRPGSPGLAFETWEATNACERIPS